MHRRVTKNSWMADTAKSVPLKALHEAVGMVITVEMDSGETFRGTLVTVEDSMNVELDTVTHTDKKGRTRELARSYVRGSNTVFFVLPDMLKHAPGFQSLPARTLPARGRGFAPARGGRGVGEKRDREQ